MNEDVFQFQRCLQAFSCYLLIPLYLIEDSVLCLLSHLGWLPAIKKSSYSAKPCPFIDNGWMPKNFEVTYFCALGTLR